MDPQPPFLSEGPLIVGVDESERSRDAIALGRQLADGLAGGLTAVYVHTLNELDALMTGHHPEEVAQLVAEHASAKESEVRALLGDMGISDVELIQASSAAAGLHDRAVKANASLVVIGSSQRSGLGRVFPGGTAERLLSGSPVPVAVAPNGHAEREVGRTAVGIGFNSSPEAREAVSWAAGFARRTGAEMHLLAVHAPLPFGRAVAGGAYGTHTVNEVLAEELQSESQQLAKSLSADLSVETHLFRGDPATLLAEHSQKLDLLVLGSRGYGPIKSVLLGSVSSFVTRNSHCPVLVVPRGADAGA